MSTNTNTNTNTDEIEVSEDEVILKSKGGMLTFRALGGSEDRVSILHSGGDFEITATTLGALELAFLNFGNTGAFDREG